MRLAIVTNILSPYRVPLFNYLAQQPGVELQVFLCAETEPNRHWVWPANIRFEYEIGSTWRWSPKPNKTIYINPGLIGRLRSFDPDVVIVGGLGLVSLMAWMGARLCAARFIVWGEGVVGADGWIGRVMRPLRVWLVHVADAFIASSQTAAEFFCSYGAYPEKITISMITLDVTAFAREVSRLRRSKDQVRRKLGLSDPVVLYVGQLERYKGVDLLLSAFGRLLEQVPLSELVIVGSGGDLEELQALIVPAWSSRVHFVGFKQSNELPTYYAIADLFALFSRREPFGLVITEALAAGLPVMCSKFAGAAYDLVEYGQNGYAIDPEDVETNARLMNHILLNDSLRARMAERSKVIAQKCTVEKAAAAMLDAVKCALNQSDN